MRAGQKKKKKFPPKHYNQNGFIHWIVFGVNIRNRKWEWMGLLRLMSFDPILAVVLYNLSGIFQHCGGVCTLLCLLAAVEEIIACVRLSWVSESKGSWTLFLWKLCVCVYLFSLACLTVDASCSPAVSELISSVKLDLSQYAVDIAKLFSGESAIEHLQQWASTAWWFLCKTVKASMW